MSENNQIVNLTSGSNQIAHLVEENNQVSNENDDNEQVEDTDNDEYSVEQSYFNGIDIANFYNKSSESDDIDEELNWMELFDE